MCFSCVGVTQCHHKIGGSGVELLVEGLERPSNIWIIVAKENFSETRVKRTGWTISFTGFKPEVCSYCAIKAKERRIRCY